MENFKKEDLMEKTARELYSIARELKIKNYTSFKKDELIDEILRYTVSNGNIQAIPTVEQISQVIQESEERLPRGGFGRQDTVFSQEDEFFATGLLETLPDGYGFLRSNYFPSSTDIYVSPPIIKRYGLRTGDIIEGAIHLPKRENEKYASLVRIKTINGIDIEGKTFQRSLFEILTPIFPNKRIRLETPHCSNALRLMELVTPIGKGQRGLIVSPPKAGKTTILKNIAQSVEINHPEITLLILLIDERPEEVTDMRHAVKAEVISSTFDQPPENHIRVVELAIERAKRLVESKKDVMILLDGITRLTRAYNLISTSSGKTLSGGLDPGAIRGPKKIIGSARNIAEGGSLTIIATALIETGSRLDQVIYEEFKGTGNMELVLDRELSERRIFPAIDIRKSGTRREDLLYTPEELQKILKLRQFLGGEDPTEALEKLLALISKTSSNKEFLNTIA